MEISWNFVSPEKWEPWKPYNMDEWVVWFYTETTSVIKP